VDTKITILARFRENGIVHEFANKKKEEDGRTTVFDTLRVAGDVGTLVFSSTLKVLSRISSVIGNRIG
jgi:hypothetical protein